MEVCRRSSWLLLLLGITLLATALQGVQGEAEVDGPSESECRPYIEKALKELEAGEADDSGSPEDGDSKEDVPTVEITTDDSVKDGDDNEASKESAETTENEEADDKPGSDESDEKEAAVENGEADKSNEADNSDSKTDENDDSSSKEEAKSNEAAETDKEEQESVEEQEVNKESSENNVEAAKADSDSKEDNSKEGDASTDEGSKESKEDAQDSKASVEDTKEEHSNETGEKEADDTKSDASKDSKEDSDSADHGDKKESDENDSPQSKEVADQNSSEEKEAQQKDSDEQKQSGEQKENGDEKDSDEKKESGEQKDSEEQKQGSEQSAENKEDDKSSEEESKKRSERSADNDDSKEADNTSEDASDGDSNESEPVEDDLTQEIDVPTDLRPRDHVEQLLKLDDESLETEKIVNRVADITLRDLKRLYENAIKPLEVLYKYRDLSNRHFGDAEIFSKPLVLFMGPWSGGKSSIINYLLDNEYNETSLRTGAEPSPAYFNILMHGAEPEVLDGTQLAADFTFSGLQKFGQGLEERLKGHKLPSKLLEKINIVEIPGILEVRKQVSRVFPFNDACQWFIDRADIIFLVYDPSKLDVGPETEAILDQLKGREHQTRIVLNKADQVKPEELMRVQGALIWNISPLMSSAQPPVMYTTSLWSRPYESWAPVRLLQAQERAFLRDLRTAYDKRIENKIASARRFAVRVRNHAKMVDCYLTTYYNHKSVFGNRKQVADEIIEHPQDYHIYEGLSTLTNISRYDLPDPEVYRDFFRLNPLYEFQQLSATCTYFRGCPINRLDVAIAYDLPELVGKHKRLVESTLAEAQAAAPES